MPKPEVALLGTGLMGFPMAANLLKAGFTLAVWNRTHSKAQPLSEMGARVCEDPKEAVAGADYVITMLSDGWTVSQCLFDEGWAAAIKPGACVLDMSSIKPQEARSHADKLEGMGLNQLDAPVSGGTKGAEAGTLAIMAGGNEDVFKGAKPVFEAMGRPVHVGPHGAGQLSKLANQAIVAATIGVVAEAMLLAEKGGADPAAIRNALKGGFADSIILQQHGERMTTDNFVPGGLSRLQLKDINNCLEEAGALNLSLPLTEQMQRRYTRFVDELDGREKDHSGIYLELKDHNKLS